MNEPRRLAAVPVDRSPAGEILSAIEACERAQAPSRPLDTRIALAIFPALAELPVLEEGVWQHPDGSRVRALRYSSRWAAAATLVLPGCWINPSAGGVIVVGPDREWSGTHAVQPIALTLAALRSRVGDGANGR